MGLTNKEIIYHTVHFILNNSFHYLIAMYSFDCNIIKNHLKRIKFMQEINGYVEKFIGKQNCLVT